MTYSKVVVNSQEEPVQIVPMTASWAKKVKNTRHQLKSSELSEADVYRSFFKNVQCIGRREKKVRSEEDAVYFGLRGAGGELHEARGYLDAIIHPSPLIHHGQIHSYIRNRREYL